VKPGPLSGGRAPRAWLRRIARAVAPLQGPRRASAWLGALSGVHPRLRDEPLFGRALGEFARRDSPAGEPAKDDRRAGQPRSVPPQVNEPPRPRVLENQPSRKTLRKAGRRPFPGAPKSCSEASASEFADVHPLPPSDVGAGLVPAQAGERADLAPLRLDSRAGRDLLARHAGQVPAVSARGEVPATSRKVQAPASLPRPAATPSSEGPASRTGREWLRDLARRGVRALRREVSGVMGAVGHGPAERGTARERTTRESPPAAEPWSMPLEGERAPADLLRQWRGPSRGPAVPSPAARRPERPHPPQAPTPVPAPAGAPAAAPPPLPGPAGAAAIPTTDAGSLSLSGLLDAALPPLLPSRDFVPPSPWKAPAQAPAAVGRPEAEVAEEDLGRLAANLKRILDEDARRHGIDV
jgi:hypothetical protein